MCRDLPQLQGLREAAEDPAFLAEWAAVKLEAKKKAAAFLQQKTGLVIDPTAMFDVQVMLSRLSDSESQRNEAA